MAMPHTIYSIINTEQISIHCFQTVDLLREYKKSSEGSILSWVLVAGKKVSGCMNTRTQKAIFHNMQ